MSSDSDNASLDGSWEEHSISSDGYSEESEGGSRNTSDEDEDKIEQNEEVEVVRGAEPYRFEPLAPARQDAEQAADADNAGDDDPAPPANIDRLNNTDWCSCGHCVVMEFAHNCTCCKEVGAIQQKIVHTGSDASNFNCFTDHPWYEAPCLNPGTLETAYYHFKQQYEARAIEGDMPRKYRHVSYRQVIRWCWGFLGRHNRVPLPSCVVQKARMTFPDPDNNYEGFKYQDMDDMM